MNNINRKTHILDAANLTAGRLAVKVVKYLTGKHKKNWVNNIEAGDFVKILNIEQLNFTGKKLKQKKYYRTSGHLGNLKYETLGNLLKKNPRQLFINIVKNMLPKNRQRQPRINRIIFK